MQPITPKTLLDLEFDKIIDRVQALCKTETGRQKAADIQVFRQKEDLMFSLAQTNEYLASFDNNNRIPAHEFEAIDKELQLLRIEGFALELVSFKKISSLCSTTNTLIRFFEEFQVYYPVLHQTAQAGFFNTFLIEQIDQIIDKFGEVKDDASGLLSQIRKQRRQVQSQINQSFGAALSRYAAEGVLDEIRESVIDNKRVLAVSAMYKKRVKGQMMGTSKTGSIIFIEPESTYILTRQLSNLLFEEAEEIKFILLKLTDITRPFADFLNEIQSFLTLMDLIAAKAKYAQQLHAVLPEIVEERRLFLRDAYHPLLYLNNKEKGATTYPQTIEFNPENRIIVISGPNAGGKSITLKTVGLLQLMLQSGFLIPIHPRSQACLFENILTDIGDHQSIENHLSTYSYRLKNMRHFLRKCQAETLFLIDEFGSGSDPELGGALAETFLEEFYHRGAFGMITTHYANLKILANELPHMANANMVFDQQSLEPTFQLRLGEAGSSYTFEVAQKNGIPFGLINRAKKKVEKGKLRFDKTILSLQKERSKYESETEKLKKESETQRNLSKKNEEIQQKIQDKLERYQELYDTHQKTIYLGNKVSEIADKYFQNPSNGKLAGKRKELTAAMIRLIEIENSKKKKPEPVIPKSTPTPIAIGAKTKKKQLDQTTVIKEIEPELEKIRQKKKEKKHKDKAEAVKPELPKNIGDRVRLLSGKAIGTIDKIEKNKAIVNYGTFTTNVNIDQLELVEKNKTK